MATNDADGTVVPLFASFAVACGAFASADAAAQRSGWMALRGGDPATPSTHLVVFARGDSMDGGDLPICHGDPLLLEWAAHTPAADLVGERVLVEQHDGASITYALKLLAKTSQGFELISTNPNFAPIAANASMRVVARLVRLLTQTDINPYANHVGERLLRRQAGALYGMETNPQFQQSGYSTNGTDAVLLVTLNKEAMSTGQHYIDAFESTDIFTWSSQSATAPDSKRGREVLEALSTGIRLHLWVRPDKKAREFEYCGLVMPISHEGSKPMQVRFRLLTPLTENAWARLGSSGSHQP